MGKKPGGGGGRADSPTGASDSSREERLCTLHKTLLSAFPHQPHAQFLEAEDKDPSQPGFIVGVESFLAPHECDAMVGFINGVGLNPPSAKDLHPKKGEAYLCRESFAFQARSPTPPQRGKEEEREEGREREREREREGGKGSRGERDTAKHISAAKALHSHHFPPPNLGVSCLQIAWAARCTLCPLSDVWVCAGPGTRRGFVPKNETAFAARRRW